MTKIATASFTEVDVPVPAGVTPGARQATLFLGTIAAGTPMLVEPGVPFSFSISIAGTYHIEVARLSTEGDVIASPASSEPFTIEPEVLMMGVPAVVTVVLADPVAVPAVVTVTQ